MWKSITLSRPYGIGLPKSPDPKNVLKAENQITFKLCKSKFKTQPNPGLKILEDECLECSVQGLTDQSSFFFFKWQTPNERFWHFNCLTFQSRSKNDTNHGREYLFKDLKSVDR